MVKKKSEHYVNNRELLEALIVYRAKVAHAKKMIYQNQGLQTTLESVF